MSPVQVSVQTTLEKKTRRPTGSDRPKNDGGVVKANAGRGRSPGGSGPLFVCAQCEAGQLGPPLRASPRPLLVAFFRSGSPPSLYRASLSLGPHPSFVYLVSSRGSLVSSERTRYAPSISARFLRTLRNRLAKRP